MYNGTQDPHPQFMANAILNFHFFYIPLIEKGQRIPSLAYGHWTTGSYQNSLYLENRM